MDTPNQRVSWLESFPPDIWARFAWYLPGEQLGRLTMTGAMLLRQRLKSPTVVKSIILGEDYMVFYSLPRLINGFPSLEELSIHSCSDSWSTKLALTIDSIPSGVRKLELGRCWKEPADKLFGGVMAPLKLNEHLPRLESLDLYDLKITGNSWICHCPQSLTKLRIHHWSGNVELPTSLIHFEANSVRLTESSFVSKLPPSLETLEVQELLGVTLLAPLLPSSIRKLYIFPLDTSPSFSRSLLEQLPKSLTWFQVPFLGQVNFETNPELTSLLPPTLTELHIPSVLPCSAWHLLPQQLTKLSISTHSSQSTVPSQPIESHGVQYGIESIPFDYLPSSITNLELKFGHFFCGHPTIPSHRSYFPPQLTQLNICNIQLSPETAKLLPSSLTLLEIGNLCERVCEQLPNSLKTLWSSQALVTPNLIKHLPQSLTSLYLSIPRSDDPWFDYKTGKAIGNVSELLEYSIQQDCFLQSFDWKDHATLPSTLTELDLQNLTELKDSFLQHQQLPNLMRLNLGQSKHFTDLSIPLLSRHLTSLDLMYSSKVSGKSFEFLPRSLTFLSLNSSESIFDCDIQHLPRTLKHAYLNRAIHLTEVCIPDLPPHLKTLDMEKNTLITSSSFPKLPYSLRSSQLCTSAQFSSWRVSWGVARSRK